MKLFYQFSTHWDREWYLTFQEFRYRLVKAVDILIDALENDKIDVFTFDGQTIVLEDYLEIRPENKERIEKLIKNGKLIVGPWYIMPDEFSVSGESIIRNFLEGHKICKNIGVDAWNYGYMCDIFGHIAQMPQILKGFNIEGAYLGRGVGGKDQRFKGFVWKSPDGSECMVYKQTYANLLRSFEESENGEELVNEFIEKEAANDMVVLNYTNDHAALNEHSFKFFELLGKLKEKFEVVEGIEKTVEHLKVHYDELPLVEGELITTGATKDDFRLAGDPVSSYYILKKANDECENLLENTISPMLVMSDLKNINIDKSFYNLAYKYLLKNQPHDSICGCSVDRVHQDMEYRYSQVKSISAAVYEDFELSMGKNIPKSDGFYIKVFNFMLKEQNGTFILDLAFEKDWQSKVSDNAGYQKINSFEILNDKGETVPYQILDITIDDIIRGEGQDYRKVDIYKIAVDSTLVPFGYSVFNVCRSDKKIPPVYSADNDLSAENEYMKVSLNADGSVNIIDKLTGKEYKNLCTFTDDGEIGNSWFSQRPVAQNRVISSIGAKTIIEKLCKGPLVDSFRVTKFMDIPKDTDYDNMSRSEEFVTTKIVTDITLRKNSKELEFKTVIDNNAKDHRIKVCFPTEIKADNYYASQAFCYNERKRGISETGANSFEPETLEKNMSGIVTVCDNQNSLSFVGREGFRECGVTDDGTIAITLLRGHGRTMFIDNLKTEYSQMNGKLTFDYALSLNINKTELFDVQKNLFGEKKYIAVNDKCNSESYMSVEGNVIQSIVKPSEDRNGYIVRLYNPSEKPVKTNITFSFDVDNVAFVNLAENKKESCTMQNNKAEFTTEPNKIITIYAETVKQK